MKETMIRKHLTALITKFYIYPLPKAYLELSEQSDLKDHIAEAFDLLRGHMMHVSKDQKFFKDYLEESKKDHIFRLGHQYKSFYISSNVEMYHIVENMMNIQMQIKFTNVVKEYLEGNPKFLKRNHLRYPLYSTSNLLGIIFIKILCQQLSLEQNMHYAPVIDWIGEINLKRHLWFIRKGRCIDRASMDILRMQIFNLLLAYYDFRAEVVEFLRIFFHEFSGILPNAMMQPSLYNHVKLGIDRTDLWELARVQYNQRCIEKRRSAGGKIRIDPLHGVEIML